MEKQRCQWCTSSELYESYHDAEWGVPVYEDRKLFEMLILEGAQAGLSWITILKKRENYIEAFDNFDVLKVSKYNEKKIAMLLANPGIIRNKLKILSTISNAKNFIKIQKDYGSFSEYQWQFVDNKPIVNTWSSLSQVPTETELSKKFSNALVKLGFKFVGSKIMYSYMQAVGMVNDHVVTCFRHKEVSRF